MTKQNAEGLPTDVAQSNPLYDLAGGIVGAFAVAAGASSLFGGDLTVPLMVATGFGGYGLGRTFVGGYVSGKDLNGTGIALGSGTVLGFLGLGGVGGAFTGAAAGLSLVGLVTAPYDLYLTGKSFLEGRNSPKPPQHS